MTPNQFLWTSASRTHVGRVRTLNEDACLDQPARGLWAVADGMGGHAIGDFASALAVDSLNKLPAPQSLAGFVADARQRLQAVNQQLREEAAARNVGRIGCTIAALLTFDAQCACLWAGDSRVYLYRDGELRQLTSDHSQVEILRSLGQLSPEEVARHPTRNLITRAVGALDTLDLDEAVIDVLDADVFLLCSDGLSNDLSSEEIGQALGAGSCRQAAETLVELALARGGRDNISAVVVRVEDLYNSDKTMLNPAL